MPETQTIRKIITSNYYEVGHNVTLKMGQSIYKTAATFNIFIKKLDSLKYDIFLDRSNFKINDQEVEAKFIALSQHYFNCLFPLRFKIQENKLAVVNFTEVMTRITEKDLELKNDYDHDSLNTIRQQFLAQVDTASKLQHFVSSLSIVQTIALSLQRFVQNPNAHIQWQLPGLLPIDFKIVTQNNENKTTYKGENKNKTLFVNQLNDYNQKNKLKIIPHNDEILFTAIFNQSINYQSDTLGFNNSQTTVKTSLGDYFDYQENISLLVKG